MCPSFIIIRGLLISVNESHLLEIFLINIIKRDTFLNFFPVFSLTLPWPVSFFLLLSLILHAPRVDDKTCCQVGREMPKGCDRKRSDLDSGVRVGCVSVKKPNRCCSAAVGVRFAAQQQQFFHFSFSFKIT